MNFKRLKKAISIKAKKSGKRLSSVAKSYVSLFIIVTLLVAGTISWFTAKDQIDVSTPLMEFNTSSGIHDSEMQTLQTTIEIPYFKLEEASSVDGRNIYFPSTFFDNASDTADAAVSRSAGANSPDVLVNWTTTNSNMQTQTLAMRYREANAGDKNVRYAYGDADINSAGTETNVWIKGYKVVIGNSVSDVNNETNCFIYHDKIDIDSDYTGQTFFPGTNGGGQEYYSCPVRIAVIDDSGHTPRIFDPSAKLADYVDKTYAVYSVTSNGTPTLRETTNLESFASYYYGTDNPLFTIQPGHSVNMTVVAWLEGTHPFAKEFSGKYVSISFEVETNVTQMEEIYLHDWTIGDDCTGVNFDNYIQAGKNWDGHSWLSGDVNIAMQYYDEFAQTYKIVEMTKQSATDSQGHTVYKGSIPNYVTTDISFYRLSKNGDDVYPGTVYNSWHTFVGVNSKLSSTASGWKDSILGNLRENRLITGSDTSCYTHYYAIRGNGYSTVAHNASDRYSKWLSPCVGYWGTASYPIGN